jgi:hypothetical protein
MRRVIATAVAFGVMAVGAGTAAGASCPGQCRAITGSPLSIRVTADSSLQVYYAGGTSGQVYPSGSERGNAGTWIGVGTTTYEPSGFTPVSQTGVTGSGSAADPFTVVTRFDVPRTTLRVTETVRSVVGNPWFRIDRRILNTGGQAVQVRVFHYADLYLLGSDRGYGYFDPATGAVGGQNATADFFQAFIPVTRASAFMEGNYAEVRGAVTAAGQGGAALPNTVKPPGDPANLVDNGAALQWNVSIPARTSRTVSDLWSFGVTPQIPPVTAPPEVTSLAPVRGPAGTTVTVGGRGFGAAAGTVTVGGVAARVVSWTDTVVRAVVPAVRAGAQPLVVARADEAGDPVTFTVAAAANLAATIPNPRVIRGGPARATYPGTVSLGALRRSRCVRVVVRSTRPARVMASIFSGRRSIRLFGQRRVVFTRAGTRVVCIPVPRRAHTFNVRTPLRFAIGWKVGARPTPREPSPAPRIGAIRLVP